MANMNEKVPTEQETPEVDPQLEQETNAYITGLMKVLHSKETSRSVLDMLSSGPPEQSIPSTALLVNAQMEDAARSKGKPPSLEVLLNAGVYLTQDLIEIGNAAGIFEVADEEQVGGLIKGTLQAYIEKGLKDKTIDPVELQEKVEPLMDEMQSAAGLEAAGATGIPAKPDQMTAMEQYATKREQGVLKGGR